VILLIHEITTLVHSRTVIVAKPMDRPLRAEVVVASVGHMPSMRTNVGLSLMMPFLMIFR
jgi:hypothetical protein